MDYLLAVLDCGAKQVFVKRKKLRARDPWYFLSSKSTKYELTKVACIEHRFVSLLCLMQFVEVDRIQANPLR